MTKPDFDEQVLVQAGEFLMLAEIIVYIVPALLVIPFLASIFSIFSFAFLSVFGVFWYAFMHFTIYHLSDWLFPYAKRLATKEVKWRTEKHGNNR